MTALAPSMYTTQAVSAAIQRKSEQLRPRTAGETLRIHLEEERLRKERKIVKHRQREQERQAYHRSILQAATAQHADPTVGVDDNSVSSPSKRRKGGVSLFELSKPIEAILAEAYRQQQEASNAANAKEAEGEHLNFHPQFQTSPTSPPTIITSSKTPKEHRIDPKVLLEAEKQRLKHLDIRFRREAREQDEERSSFWRWYWQRHRDIDKKYMDQGVYVSSVVSGSGAFQTPQSRKQRVHNGSTPWSSKRQELIMEYQAMPSTNGTDNVESPMMGVDGGLTDSVHYHHKHSTSTWNGPEGSSSASQQRANFSTPSSTLRREFETMTSSVLFKPPPFVPGIESDDEIDTEKGVTSPSVQAGEGEHALPPPPLNGYKESHKKRLLKIALQDGGSDTNTEEKQRQQAIKKACDAQHARRPKVTTVTSNTSYLSPEKHCVTIDNDNEDAAHNREQKEELDQNAPVDGGSGANNEDDSSGVLALAARRAAECTELLANVQRRSRLHHLHMQEKHESEERHVSYSEQLPTAAAVNIDKRGLLSQPPVTTPQSNPSYIEPEHSLVLSQTRQDADPSQRTTQSKQHSFAMDVMVSPVPQTRDATDGSSILMPPSSASLSEFSYYAPPRPSSTLLEGHHPSDELHPTSSHLRHATETTWMDPTMGHEDGWTMVASQQQLSMDDGPTTSGAADVCGDKEEKSGRQVFYRSFDTVNDDSTMVHSPPDAAAAAAGMQENCSVIPDAVSEASAGTSLVVSPVKHYR